MSDTNNNTDFQQESEDSSSSSFLPLTREEQKIYSKVGILIFIFDMESSKFEVVKRLFACYEAALLAKDLQLVEERHSNNDLRNTLLDLHMEFNECHQKWMDKLVSYVEINDDLTLKLKGAENKTNACFLCYNQMINCVFSPCRHQLCCFQCAQRMNVCPICNGQSNAIRIYLV